VDCRQVQDWLLQAEDAHPVRCDAPAVATHLRRCAPCRGLAGRLVRLEDAWRDFPLPAGADQARAAFVQRVPDRPLPRHPARPPLLRFLTGRRWAVAALLLLTTGVGFLLMLPPQQTREGGSRLARQVEKTPDVVERLVAWNLDLAQAPAPAERKHLYAAQVASLKAAVQQAELPANDRALADTLIENGTWLADNDDPVAEADRFNEVADQLLTRMDAATDRKDVPRLNRLADIYRRVADQGVAANIEEAVATGPLEGERQKQLEQTIQRDAGRAKKLAKLLERAPEASHTQIRQALDRRKHPGHKMKKKNRKS